MDALEPEARDPNEPCVVNQEPANDESAAARAARELSQLQEQTAQARAVLIGVQRDLAEATSRLVNTQAQLLEANEKLELARLRAPPDAETTSQTRSDVRRLGEFDALTGLPNLVLLFDRFERAIALAERRGSRLALLFLDLSDFKQVNDTLG